MNITNFTIQNMNNPSTCQALIDKAFSEGVKYNDLITRNQLLSVLGNVVIIILILIMFSRRRKLRSQDNADEEKIKAQDHYIEALMYFSLLLWMFFIISNGLI